MTLRLLAEGRAPDPELRYSAKEEYTITDYYLVEQSPTTRLICFRYQGRIPEDFLDLAMPWVYMLIKCRDTTYRFETLRVTHIACRPDSLTSPGQVLYELPVAHQYLQGNVCAASYVGNYRQLNPRAFENRTQRITTAVAAYWQEKWRYHDDWPRAVSALAAKVGFSWNDLFNHRVDEDALAFRKPYQYWEKNPDWARKLGWGKFDLGSASNWADPCKFLDEPVTICP